MQQEERTFTRSFTREQLTLIGEAIFAKTMDLKKAAKELHPSSAASMLKEQVKQMNDVFDIVMGSEADALVGRLCSPFDD